MVVSTAGPEETGLPRGLVPFALVVLLVFIGHQSRVLWQEWHQLRGDLTRVRHTAVIGYQNISPRQSFAQRPKPWFRYEGKYTFLWGGWDPHKGHQWFRIGHDDLDPEAGALSPPIGRDIFQTIDEPMIEEGGGPIWGRIPSESLVVGLDLAGIESVYPVLVLKKVQVVNDLIAERPLLVTYNPMLPPEEAVDVYDAEVDGRRVTMGLSGYRRGPEPLLYDHESESLWIDGGEGLRAIAGGRKGKALHEVARPSVVAWGDWRRQHPRSRLLVGAVKGRKGRHSSPGAEGP
jgi:hypothetical protein